MGLQCAIADIYPENFPEILDLLSDSLNELKPFKNDPEKLKKIIEYKMKKNNDCLEIRKKEGKEEKEQYIRKKIISAYPSTEAAKVDQLIFYFLLIEGDEPSEDLQTFMAHEDEEKLNAFLEYIYESKIKDTGIYENYKETMRFIQSNSVALQIQETNKQYNVVSSTLAGGFYFLSDLNPESFNKLINTLPDSLRILSRSAAKKLYIGIVVVDIAWKVANNIFRWWRGKITGKQCAANIINNVAELGMGVTGAVGGAYIGMSLGPCGVVAGGIIGGAFSCITAKHYFENFTKELFDLPQLEAAGIAYQFLGIHHQASDFEIRKAYLDKCKKYHPDKGGSQENFLKLKECMLIIKADRGYFTN